MIYHNRVHNRWLKSSHCRMLVQAYCMYCRRYCLSNIMHSIVQSIESHKRACVRPTFETPYLEDAR